MLAPIDGVLWKQFGSGDWYTVAEVGPGLYAYRYSDDPSRPIPGRVDWLGTQLPSASIPVADDCDAARGGTAVASPGVSSQEGL